MTRIDTKDALRSVVDRVGTICGRFRVDSLASQLAACEELLCGGGVVDVAGFLDRELSTIEGLVGTRMDSGSRGEEIRAALSELSALESTIR